MSVLKAKEFDRLGNHQKLTEYQNRIRTLEYEKEVLEGETKRSRELEEELEFFKNSQDEHFQQFEEKFEEISSELQSLKEENSALKKNETQLRDRVKLLIKEKDELLRDLQNSENMDVNIKDKRLYEIENMLKTMMDKSQLGSKEELIRKSLSDQENKNRKSQMVFELQEKIQKFKDDQNRKKTSKEYFINE